MKKIEEVIDELFKNFIEEAIQNIGIGPFITSREAIKSILQKIHEETNSALTMQSTELLEHFSIAGATLYNKYRVPAFLWIDTLEKLKEDILYAIHHQIIDYDDDAFILRMNKLIQGLCKGYLKASAQDTLNFTYERIDAINIEMDIMSHDRWYKDFLEFLANDFQNVPELMYENSESNRWIKSLDFKLLMKACTFEREGEIVIFMHKLYDLSREIKHFIDIQDFKNAYSYLIILDQKVNLLNDILKEVLINFMSDKLHFFFTLFSEIILFKKQYSYFLTLSVSLSSEVAHKRDIHRLFLAIYKGTKNRSKDMAYQFTGVVDDGDSMHFLLHYNEKSDVEKIFTSVTQTIYELKKEEITLNVPEFIVRASETEVFSGLSAATLQKIAFNMAQQHVHVPNYHFNKIECSKLRESADRKAAIDEKVLKAIKDKTMKLYFQPIVHVYGNEKKLVYCEALSRMSDEGKIIDAEEFIHSVLDQKLSSKLDILVYQELMQRTSDIAAFMEGVSVNIFPESFKDKKVIDALKKCLLSFQEKKLILTLEITEYNLFEYYDILLNLKKEFTSTLRVAVDDFGSGYSSLAALVKLSKNGLLDAVKIDGTLTCEILNDATTFEIVKTAASLSKTLNVKTIIEYIENKEIELKLQEEVDDFYGQGYLYAAAMPLEKVKKTFS